MRRKKHSIQERILYRITPPEEREALLGDFRELQRDLKSRRGRFWAALVNWIQITALSFSYARETFFWGCSMFLTNVRIYIRNLKRHKGYSLINIFGLTLGLMCTMFITMYIREELSYDRFHKNSARIFRLEKRTHLAMQFPLAPFLQDEIPEIENIVRIYAPSIWGRSNVVSGGDKHFYTDRLIYADPSLFEMFTVPLRSGNPDAVLPDTNAIVISQEMAEKYFGNKNPLGEILNLDNRANFIVTGVMENLPHNTHLNFDFVIHTDNYGRSRGKSYYSWGNSACLIYVQIHENSNPAEMEKKIEAALILREKNKQVRNISLMPLTNIHLHSDKTYEYTKNSSIVYVYIFAAIASLILVIACMNFINLSTARSAKRAREVGMRKVVGAQRKQLIKQFIGESMLLSLLAFTISIVLITILTPYFNSISGKDLSLQPNILFYGLLITLFAGFSAGSFPAFYISSIKPVSILRGSIKGDKASGSRIRSVLVILQYTISIALIISTAVVAQQMNFLKNSDLGFKKDRIIAFRTNRGPEAVAKAELLADLFRQNSQVIGTAISSKIPGDSLGANMISRKGEEDETASIDRLIVDPDFLETYKMKLAAGRFFSKQRGDDAASTYILNETAAKMLGWPSPESAVGQPVVWNQQEGQVIGVIKDIHFNSLHSRITPLLLTINPKRFWNISVLVKPENISSTTEYLKAKWNEVLPNRPADYVFVDDNYASQYTADEKIKIFLTHFTFIAIFIACLGLFGLAAFTVEQRTKEIGIRKVLGAQDMTIFMILSKYFVGLVLISNLFAWPAAYLFMNKWLQNFAYRASIGPLVFIISAFLAMGISLMTISYQTVKAFTANPVDSLRYE